MNQNRSKNCLRYSEESVRNWLNGYGHRSGSYCPCHAVSILEGIVREI